MTLKPRTAHGPEDLWPVSTGTYETVLVWLRMQFAVVSPGVIAVLSKDVRKRVGGRLRNKRSARSRNRILPLL